MLKYTQNTFILYDFRRHPQFCHFAFEYCKTHGSGAQIKGTDTSMLIRGRAAAVHWREAHEFITPRSYWPLPDAHLWL